MIYTFIVDKKVYNLAENVINPEDGTRCYAYISCNDEVFGNFYTHVLVGAELNRLRKLLLDKHKSGCQVLIVKGLDEDYIRPLDIVRSVEDPTWVGIVKEGGNNHFSVRWFDNDRAICPMPKCAWHNIEEGEVEKIANLPDFLSECMSNQFLGGTKKPYELI